MYLIIIRLTIALIAFLIGASFYAVWNINQQSIDIPLPNHSSSMSVEKPNHIRTLISYLSLEDDTVRVEAKKELITLGQRFPEQRTIIIRELLHSVEQQDKIVTGKCFVLEGATLLYWSSVTTIFAELKASEAVNVMVRTIHCGDGYTGNNAERPSLDALIQMGTIAVPKLSEALLSEPDAYKRSQIVICLGTIGGPQAKLALRRALPLETSKDVIWLIKYGLSNWQRNSN